MSVERMTYRRRESNETGYKNACDTHRIPDVIDKLAAYEDAEESGELVRVVRCKDCAYNIGQSKLHKGFVNCAFHCVEMGSNGFCDAGITKRPLDNPADQV